MFRCPTYLSPSALAVWETNPDEAFVRYIVPKDIRPARKPQTGPMSVGSAFDALVKSALYYQFLDEGLVEVRCFRIRDLVVSQCQPHTLPESLEIACDVYEQYVECGAYEDLAAVIQEADQEPRMEFDVVANVHGVPLLGKPDLHFKFNGCHVITDWKVSGSVSKHGVSPQQGFKVVRDIRNSSSHCTPHRSFDPMPRCGLTINRVPMNEATYYWADQLATYAWALGERVGSESYVCRIEQLACRPSPVSDDSDRLRVKCATHQSYVSEDYQLELIERYKRVWSHVSSGHFFADLSRAESDARASLMVERLSGRPGAYTPGDTIPEIQW